MNLHRKILTLILVALVSLASACSSSLAAPTNTPAPGLSEGDIRTQAVGTALAALTASAPSPTRTATVTPQPTLTNTPTAIPTEETPLPPTRTLAVWPTPTVTYTPAQTDFTCEIIEQSPGPEDDTFEPKADFDVSVRVKNTGDNNWHYTKVLFIYTNGKYMQQKDGPVLVPDTDKSQQAHMVVDMEAPDTPGTYQTSYALIIGKLFFCPVHFTIKVK